MTPKDVEKKLQKLIEKYNLNGQLTVKMIKEWVYHEQGAPMQSVHEFQDKCLNYFPQDLDIEKMNEILQIITEAWNSYPHQSLGGKSPHQMVEEYKQ